LTSPSLRDGASSLMKDFATSPVYDLYWRFACERQAVYFRRLEGKPGPWSDDPIFQSYRFTNAYRAADRVSQFLIREVIYNPAYPDSPVEIAFRVLLFKLFNKIDTWRLLEREIGALNWQSFDQQRYAAVLGRAIGSGDKIYSAAYIMPPVRLSQSGVKHEGHLMLIDYMLTGDFVSRLQQSEGLQDVFELLKTYPSLGDFLAFQLAIDFNYTTLVDHDEGSFVVAGPGARDGLAKTFPGSNDVDPVRLIRLMMDRQEQEFERLGLNFQSLFGRRLQLIDCQNLFCEISKYTRASHPDIVGLSGRTRIKQMFRPLASTFQPWFPPKWGINDQIPSYPQTARQDDLFEAAS
jgi:alpha-glutamyl/putrescinyl thymine pyrophosphorylase clade 1